jgi:hypothetical protein
MPKPHPYSEVIRKLRKHDPRFVVWKNRAKGSERMIYHPDIGGRPKSYPLKCHGANTEIEKGHLKAIIRRFNLPADFFN